MNNFVALAFAATLLATSVACKKSYTCTCHAAIPERTENGIKKDAVDSTIITNYSGKKADAEAMCQQQKTTQDSVTKLLNATINCELTKK